MNFKNVGPSLSTINEVCEIAKDVCNDFPNCKKLKARAKIKPADVTSYCNKQMGIKLEKTAVERYEHEYNVTKRCFIELC